MLSVSRKACSFLHMNKVDATDGESCRAAESPDAVHCGEVSARQIGLALFRIRSKFDEGVQTNELRGLLCEFAFSCRLGQKTLLRHHARKIGYSDNSSYHNGTVIWLNSEYEK